MLNLFRRMPKPAPGQHFQVPAGSIITRPMQAAPPAAGSVSISKPRPVSRPARYDYSASPPRGR